MILLSRHRSGVCFTTEVPKQRRVASSLSRLCLLSAMGVPVSQQVILWFDKCLEVDRCSSVDGLEGRHHCLELDAGRNRKSVEVMEEAGSHGRI